MMELVANTYRNDLLDMEMRAEEFEAAGRIAAAIPIRRVSPHTDSVYLANLCEVIVEDFLTLTTV